jgi:hypothetical protein
MLVFLFMLLESFDKIQLIIRYLSFGSKARSFMRLILLEFIKQNQKRDYADAVGKITRR